MLGYASSRKPHRVSRRPFAQARIWGVMAWTILLSVAACAPAPPLPPAPPPPPWNGGANPSGGPVFHGGTLVSDRLAPSHTSGTLCFTVAGWCTLGAAEPIPAQCDCHSASGAQKPTEA